MNDLAGFRRSAVATSLVAAPVLAVLSSALHPPFTEGYADRLADVAEAGVHAWLSNAAFTALQVPMLVAFLGIAHLLRHRSTRLAAVASVLGVLATFGEAVMGGIGLVWLTVAPDVDDRAAFAGAWEQLESSPVMVCAMVGFLGTVLTLVLLSIGLFRTRVVPRWVPALLWGFLLLEFVGSNLSAFASYAAGLCLLAAYGTIAVHVHRTPREAWDAPGVAGARPAGEGASIAAGSRP